MSQVQPSGPRLSAETVHASTVALDGRAVLISGPSGSGKSDLALRLLDRAFTLVSDDQTIFSRDGDRMLAAAPPNSAGKLEIRGIGIVEIDHIAQRAQAIQRNAGPDLHRDERKEKTEVALARGWPERFATTPRAGDAAFTRKPAALGRN